MFSFMQSPGSVCLRLRITGNTFPSSPAAVHGFPLPQSDCQPAQVYGLPPGWWSGGGQGRMWPRPLNVP